MKTQSKLALILALLAGALTPSIHAQIDSVAINPATGELVSPNAHDFYADNPPPDETANAFGLKLFQPGYSTGGAIVATLDGVTPSGTMIAWNNQPAGSASTFTLFSGRVAFYAPYFTDYATGLKIPGSYEFDGILRLKNTAGYTGYFGLDGGAINFQPSSSLPADGNAALGPYSTQVGTIRFYNGHFHYHNGSGWVQFADSTSSSSSPPLSTAGLRYNSGSGADTTATGAQLAGILAGTSPAFASFTASGNPTVHGLNVQSDGIASQGNIVTGGDEYINGATAPTLFFGGTANISRHGTGVFNLGTGARDNAGGTLNLATLNASAGLTGPGSGITSLNASALASGTVPDARMPGNVPLTNVTTTISAPWEFASSVYVSGDVNFYTGNGIYGDGPSFVWNDDGVHFGYDGNRIQGLTGFGSIDFTNALFSADLSNCTNVANSVNGYTGSVTGAQAVAGAAIYPASMTVDGGAFFRGGLTMAPGNFLMFSHDSYNPGAGDVGFYRIGAGVIRVTAGYSGYGSVELMNLTANGSITSGATNLTTTSAALTARPDRSIAARIRTLAALGDRYDTSADANHFALDASGHVTGSSGGGSFAEYLRLPGLFADENWIASITFSMQNINGSSYGTSISIRSGNTWYPTPIYTAFINPSNDPTGLQLVKGGDGDGNFAWGGVSPVAFSVSNDDMLRLTLRRAGVTLTARCENLTRNTVAELSMTADLQPGGGNFSPPNSGYLTINNHGGTYTIHEFRFESESLLAPDLLCIGDSKTAGISVGNEELRWADRVGVATGKTVRVEAGNGDRTVEMVQTANALTLAPKIVVICLGRNDIGSGVSNATWQANYAAIVARAQSWGAKVCHVLPIPEPSLDQSALRTWLLSTYPGATIDPAAGWDASTMLSTDNLHPNALGQQHIADAVRTTVAPLF